MTICKIAFVALAMIFIGLRADAQQRVSIAFYNTGNLYDTIPSPFYDDAAYTPKGRNGWNTERYGHKLRNIARVIGDGGFDVVGLAEVENEGVVRDLVVSLADDYNYIHATSGDRRGIDLALLYKGDKFFPESWRLINSASSREFLYVRGKLLGEEVNILVCHLPSKTNRRDYREGALARLASVADSLQRNDRPAKLLVMGDFNCDPSERAFRKAFGRQNGGFYDKAMLYGGVTIPVGGGVGSYAYDGRWFLMDNILLSLSFVYGEGLAYDYGGVFVRDYLLAGPAASKAVPAYRRGYPLRTFTSGVYTAGYSDHLPVFVVLGR